MGSFSGGEFNMIFLVDHYSLVFFSFVLLISFSVLIYRFYYISGDVNLERFCYIVLFFIISIGILILSPSFIGVMLGWDGLGVTSFLLVIYYNNVSSLRSGLITIYTNRFGDVCILMSFFITYT